MAAETSLETQLGDYYTLPSGGRFVNRGGKPDTWYYRVLKRIPEHFEEVFYEVAMVTLPNGDRVKTMEESREIAMWFIEHFGWLFANEYEFVKQGLTGEERRIERLKRSKNIMNRIVNVHFSARSPEN